jgi:hypothetical protein
LENNRILKLIAKEQLSVISEEEQKELDEWIESSPLNRQFYDRFINEDDVDDKNDGQYSADASWKRFEQKYYGTVRLKKPKQNWWNNTYVGGAARVILALATRSKLKRRWWRSPYGVATAACLILIVLAGIFYWRYSSNTISGKCIAVIKRSDGAILKVYESEKKVLADAEGIQIINEGNGKLKYTRGDSNLSDKENIVDSITTHTGGQCNITLIDGTKIWLNARSTLVVPANLNHKERLVALSGEGYFEVNPQISPVNKSKRAFIVKVKDVKVNVLGTHFNIMAYDDEQTISTTLFEGAVKIETKDSVAKLIPGQQANISKTGSMVIIHPADVNNSISWKNGRMKFDKCRLDSIMRQAARWYDMEFVCEGNCHKLYTITLMKNEALMTILQDLEKAEGVRFDIQGKKIIAR